MARLLACWEMGGGLGHVAQLAGAARPLAALGHESWLASRDVVTGNGLAGGAFARVVQAPLWLRGTGGAARGAPIFSFGQLIAGGGFADDEGLCLLVKAWLGLFTLTQPAAIYGSFAPASLLAAHVARLPAARIGTPFTCPAANGPASLMPWVRAATPRDDAVADRVVRAVCRHFGAPVLSGLGELLGAAAPFLTSWPELHPGAARTDSDDYGPLDGLGLAGAHEGGLDWPDAPGPRVLVYLSLGAAQAAPLVAALGARGWPVLWVSREAFAGGLPGNIRHAVEPVPLRAAMDADAGGARIFVTRGGHGAALEAVWAGCPMLVLPDTLETDGNARALVEAGLALRLAQADGGWAPGSLGAAGPLGAALDGLADDDAAARRGAAAARLRHREHDPAAAAALMARRMARALRLL